MGFIYKVYDVDGRLKTKGTVKMIAHRYGVDQSLVGMCAKENKKLLNRYKVTREADYEIKDTNDNAHSNNVNGISGTGENDK